MRPIYGSSQHGLIKSAIIFNSCQSLLFLPGAVAFLATRCPHGWWCGQKQMLSLHGRAPGSRLKLIYTQTEEERRPAKRGRKGPRDRTLVHTRQCVTRAALCVIGHKEPGKDIYQNRNAAERSCKALSKCVAHS